ncbi:MAG: DUF4272 domain-containing protein [Bacteroidota bacterium]
MDRPRPGSGSVVPVDAVPFDAEALRARSVAFAAGHGLPMAEGERDGIPRVTSPARLRSEAAAVNRAIVLSVVLTCAYGFPKARALRWLEREQVLGAVRDLEMQFLSNTYTDKALFYDQVEALWALAWALSLVDDFRWDAHCGKSLATHFPELNDAGRRSAFAAKCTLRPAAALIEEADRAEVLHAAMSTRPAPESARGKTVELYTYVQPPTVEVDPEAPPRPLGGVLPFALAERRRALRWLVGGRAWYD